MERPVSKNEKLSLHRVFAGRVYTVAMENDQGKRVVVMEPFFASSPEDAMEQVKEAFPEEMRKYPEKFTVSEVPNTPMKAKDIPRDLPAEPSSRMNEEPPYSMVTR